MVRTLTLDPAAEILHTTPDTVMWNRLMLDAIKADAVKERFTLHDLRAHCTTYFKLKFGKLPDLHANPATTVGVYKHSKQVQSQAL